MALAWPLCRFRPPFLYGLSILFGISSILFGGFDSFTYLCAVLEDNGQRRGATRQRKGHR